MTSDEFRELLAGMFEGRRDKIEGDQLLYESLGLMNPGTSLYDILLTFSTEGAFGWFDLDDEKQYVVLDSKELSLAHERTYVNEYVNHLQAVNFDIRAKYERRQRRRQVCAPSDSRRRLSHRRVHLRHRAFHSRRARGVHQ